MYYWLGWIAHSTRVYACIALCGSRLRTNTLTELVIFSLMRLCEWNSLRTLHHAHMFHSIGTRTQSRPCERNPNTRSWTKTGVLLSSREFFILLYGCVFALLFHTRDSVALYFSCSCYCVLLFLFVSFVCKIHFSLTTECEYANRFFFLPNWKRESYPFAVKWTIESLSKPWMRIVLSTLCSCDKAFTEIKKWIELENKKRFSHSVETILSTCDLCICEGV